MIENPSSEKVNMGVKQIKTMCDILASRFKIAKETWNNMVDAVDQFEQDSSSLTVIVEDEPERVMIAVDIEEATEKVLFYQKRLLVCF